MSEDSGAGRRGAAASESRVEVLSDAQSSRFLDAWFDITSADHFWFQWRLRASWRLLVGSEVSRSAPLQTLEVGCGTGVLRAQLEAGTAWSIDAADLDRPALENVPAGRGRVLFYDLHDRLECFHEAYDLIVLYDVLEHVVDTGPFIDSLLYHLKPGGHLLVNVPALSCLFGRFDEAVGHVRRYDKRSLASEFHGFGVEIRDMRYWGFSLVPVAMLRKLFSRWQGERDAVIERGMNPPGKIVHALFKGVMRIEDALLRRPPFGASLLLVAQKGQAGQSRPAG